MIDSLPIFGICGWSGSGKTTLIERVLPHLAARGLTVAVVKHEVHVLDRPGKDSDRLYRAGGNVFLWGPDEGFSRLHHDPDSDWTQAVVSLARRYDLVLIEGHKSSPTPKAWLLSDGEAAPPADVREIAAVLPRDAERLAYSSIW